MTDRSANQQQAEQYLAGILQESSGLSLQQLDRTATFLELGFDSLFLIQLSQRMRRALGVKVAFRQLIEDVATIDGLVRYLAEHTDFAAVLNTKPATVPTASAPPVAVPPADCDLPSACDLTVDCQPVAGTPPPDPIQVLPQWLAGSLTGGGGQVPANSAAPSSAIEQIVLQQNQLMLQHLALLSGQPQAASASVASVPAAAPPAASVVAASVTTGAAAGASASVVNGLAGSLRSASAEPLAASPVATGPATPNTRERFGPYKPVRKGLAGGLTDQQQQHLQAFMEQYTARTAKSRQHAQMYRSQFADPRGVAGYRRIWKSMVYQIVVNRSKGSKLWDIDGNQYIDIAMGFGLNLFGQSPDFVTKALHRQLDSGVEVGPQMPLAGEVAELLCQFSRKDRVTFCNTGSEAVMAALRLARTVTGKNLTVYFNKDYHGNFDQVLLRSQNVGGQAASAPAAPGVPQWYGENTIVLPYGEQESLRVIAARADEIAAVLVEPVQSADPFMQPKEFLKQLRELTKQNRIALVMDEVITGFRAAVGGAQEWFDVWGDMATYGKVLGGGMPIGALAGTSEYMDALDGGNWRYEDDSEPDADMTFFAGTFVRHPLAIAAAYEVLKKIKEEGPALQQRLTERTTYLVNTLNQFFQAEQFPIRVAQFCSLFRMMFPPDLEYADMLYFHLLARGIFTRGWGDNCFLSTEHTDQDIQRIITAVQESCLEIRQGGFFPEKPTASEEKKNSAAPLCPLVPEPDAAAQGQAVAVTGAAEPAVRMSTIHPIQEQGSRPPLFCMHAADGLTLIYHELAECLGNDQPVYGLDSPAIYRDPIPDTLEELAARFIGDMREIQPTGPYLIVGYCSGGTTALEVAQQLLRDGQQVAMLGLLETYNWLEAPSTHPTVWVQVHYQLQRLQFHAYNFWLLGLREKQAFLRSKFAALVRRTQVWRSAVAGWLGRSTMDRSGLVDMAEIWRKHDDLAEAYIPQKYPSSLLHLRPRRDYRCHVGPDYQADSVEMVRLPVYPAGMMVRPFVQQLAGELERRIQRGLAKVRWSGQTQKLEPTSDQSVLATNLTADPPKNRQVRLPSSAPS